MTVSVSPADAKRPRAATSWTVSVHPDIAQVDPGLWNSFLDPEDLLATHRFVGICQRSGIENADYRHLLVYRGPTPVAIASLCRIGASLDLLTGGRIREFVRRARRRYPSLLRVPVVLCGLPVSFGRSCLRFRAGVDHGPALDLVAQEAEEWAETTEAGIVCFKEFGPEESPALAPLVARGYLRASSLPFCTLPIRWPSVHTYLACMRSGYRRQVQATLRARKRERLELRWQEDFALECPRLYKLYGQVMDRAEFSMERLPLTFLEHLEREFGAASRTLLVRRDGELLAGGVVLDGPHETTFLLAGIDYDQNRETQAYVTLVTEIVAEAIRRGATQLHLGQTSYDLKRRLGAVTLSREIYVRCRSPVLHRLLRLAAGRLFPLRAYPPRRVHRLE
jgi:hypothetical protein